MTYNNPYLGICQAVLGIIFKFIPYLGGLGMNNDLLLKRIDELCAEKGVKKTTAFTDSHVGKNFASNLKTSNPQYNQNTEPIKQGSFD